MLTPLNPLTPKEIVAELDRHIIGQQAAKRAVAVALRNRWRRQQLDDALKTEVLPKNILMIGPTGVGKTEIARRLSKLADAPFIKVEATKFTEVGYVGRDVEQIIRDLMDAAVSKSRLRLRAQVKDAATLSAEERVLDVLVGDSASPETRQKFRAKLRAGDLDDKEIDIEVAESSNPNMPTFDVPGMPGAQMGMINLGDIFGKSLGSKSTHKKMLVRRALEVITHEESDKLLDDEKIVEEALRSVEENGIVFLDEIDKICTRSDRHEGGVSREGVQRDLLPLLEGTAVPTKYGVVNTDHILFIASGAFHVAKPSDLLPELQGRLPNRVEMESLTEEDFVSILTDTEASLIKQYTALLKTEGVDLVFPPEGIKAIARIANQVNQNVENIGARRLHTVLEKLLEDISFEAPDQKGQKILIDEGYVNDAVQGLAQNADLSKFIL